MFNSKITPTAISSNAIFFNKSNGSFLPILDTQKSSKLIYYDSDFEKVLLISRKKLK